MGGGVGVVAVGTVPRLDRRVDERKLQLFLERLVAGQADLPLRPRLQAELVLGSSDKATAAVETIARRTRDGLGSKRHVLSPVIALLRDGNPRRTVRRTGRAAFP